MIPWRTDEGTLIERIAKVKQEFRKLVYVIIKDDTFLITMLIVWIVICLYAIITAFL